MCIATKGMLFIFRFPLLLQLLLLQRFLGLIAQQCDSEESIVGMMLQRHIFKIMRPSSSLHCLQACNSNVRCQSFNYDFSDGICELNNHTKEDKPEDFIPNFTRYYFGKARKRGLLLLIGVNVLFLVVGCYIFSGKHCVETIGRNTILSLLKIQRDEAQPLRINLPFVSILCFII